MAANLVEQVRELEGKIRAAMAAAKAIQADKHRLEKELTAAREALAAAETRSGELDALRAQLKSASSENQDLVHERDEVRKRVDAMLATLGELEEAAVRG